jgi:hypothetical protein
MASQTRVLEAFAHVRKVGRAPHSIASENGNPIDTLIRDWRTVHADMRACGLRRAELDALEVKLLREAEELRVWREVGCATILEYLERELGYTPRQGRERLRIARALRDLPELEASLASGELKHTAIRELTRVVMPETERAWLDRARGKTIRELEELVAGRSPGDLPDDPQLPPDQRPGRLVFEDILPEVRALARQARVILAGELGESLDDNAFLAQLFGSALRGGTGDSDQPSHQIAVTECKCGRAWQHGGGRTFELDQVGLELAKCDATHIGSLDASEPARAKADIPPSVRRLVLHRDRKCCTVPGCRSSRFLDLHHIVPRELGGSHEPENLTTLCVAHHQMGHRGVLKISGRAPDRLQFASATIPVVARQALDTSPRREVVPAHPEPSRRFADAAIESQARDGLVSLGFKPKEAREAIALARPQLASDAPLEDLLFAALRHCRRPLA